MKVACISAASALGGSEWSLLDFARRAKVNGIDATVILPKGGPLHTALGEAGVDVRIAEAPASLLSLSQRNVPGPAEVLSFTRGMAAWAKSIRSALSDLRSPVIYSNGFKAHLVSTLLGGKRVWHLREFPPARTGIVWKTLAGALPNCAIANSNAVADAWALLGWRRPVVVHNGIDLDRFKPAEPTGWIHQTCDIAPETKLIGMPAVLAKWKGHIQVVEAFERLAKDVPNVHLALVGGAIYDTSAERGFAEELVRRVRGGGQTSRIHFVKHQSEPWKLYPEFAFSVHFSIRPEPFGRVVAESLACGVPCIAAKAGGPMEIVDDGVTGWLVPPGDVAALAQTMRRALGQAPTMRLACRKAAEDRFNADRYAFAIAEQLRKCAGA